MKKRVFLIILSTLCLSASACQNGQSQDVVSGDDLSIHQDGGEVKDGTSMDDIMIPDEEVYGQGITLSDRTQENFVIINEDDADVIRDLFMDESRYVQTAPNCLMDCFLNVDGVEIQYHSDCGTLMRFDNGMSMKLSEDEKVQVNDILGKYLSLGFGEVQSVLPDVFVGKIQLSVTHKLSEEDAEILYGILSDEARFDDALSDCLSDCIVVADRKSFVYHSDCGTFNDNEKGRCITLSDDEKTLVNEILSKYITLGYDVSEQKNEVSVGKSNSGSSSPDMFVTPLSEEDADTVANILADNSRFVTDLFKCSSDCVVSANGCIYGYCLSCGTFNDTSNNRGIQLTEAEKKEVNDILGKYVEIEVVDSWGLTLSAENVTPEGLTLTFMQQGGVGNAELLTGSFFVIEKYTAGEWISVKTVEDDLITWTAEAWLIPADSKGEWNVNWSFLYGALESGKYRIGKNISYYVESGDSKNKRYYAEFEIPDKSTDLSKKWGVSLYVARCSADGMLLYCTQNGPTLGKSVIVDGRKYSAMTVGMEYWLEKFEKDSWVKLSYLTEDTVPTWSQMFEMIELDTTMSWNIEWRDLYGHLPEGQYRIGKKITGKLDDGEYEAFNIYSVFEISSPVYSAEDWGISAEVSEVNNNSISFVIRQDGGSVWQELEMNEVSMNLEGFRFSNPDYYIEKFNGSYWTYLEPLNSKLQIIAGVGKYSVLELSESLGFTVDWSERYGALPVGQYRLVKEFSVKDNSFSQINVPVYIDFEVK